MPKSISRGPSFFWIFVAYVAGLGAAFLTSWALGPSPHALWVVACADAAATVAVFLFSVAFDNTSVYDPYWSVAPIAIAPYLAMRPEAESGPFARKVLVCSLVAFWGLRLTYNWAVGFTGLGHEDWRYVDMRKKTGKLYWLTSFFGLHFFPTVLVFLGCFPLVGAFCGSAPLGVLDGVAAFVTFGAIMIELIADEQLRTFRRNKKDPGEIIKSGLWATSRHPNYLGEILFWWGLLLTAVASGGAKWWSALGAIAITALFVIFSIPMLDRRSVERRPAYADHMKRVSRLIPWFPKNQ